MPTYPDDYITYDCLNPGKGMFQYTTLRKFSKAEAQLRLRYGCYKMNRKAVIICEHKKPEPPPTKPKDPNAFDYECTYDDHQFRREYSCINVPDDWDEGDVLAHIYTCCYKWGASVSINRSTKTAHVTEYID